MLIASILPKKSTESLYDFFKKRLTKKSETSQLQQKQKETKLLSSLKLTYPPENGWLEDEISYWVSAYFQGFGLLVSQRVFLDAKMLFGLKQPKEVLGDRIH